MKYLTPSCVVRGFRFISSLFIDAFPASQVIIAGPRFPASNYIRCIQSSMSFSYLNHEVDLSQSGGSFTITPLTVDHCSVASARYAPYNELAEEIFEKLWTSIKSSS